VIEDEIISLIPNSPCTNHKYFHEKVLIELLLSQVELAVDVQSLIP
jgi:hypothetical protein